MTVHEGPQRDALAMWRISSREQQEGFSLDAQARAGHVYAGRHDLKIRREWRVVESAWQPGRETIRQIIEYCREHPEIKVLLFEKTDRMGRNFPEFLLLKKLVMERGLEIHLFKAGRILHRDSPPIDWFIQNMDVSVGELNSDTISQEAKKGMREKAEQGLWPSAAPFGYLNNNKTKNIDPDPIRSPMFVRMAELYATGRYSLQRIVELAYAEGLRSKKDNKVNDNSWWLYFKNLVYTGDFMWGGKRYKGTYKPLWSLEMHKALLKALRREGKGHRTAWGEKDEIVFRGMGICMWPKCPDFGRRVLTGNGPKKENPDYVYYHCSIHSKPAIRQDKLAEKLGERLRDLVIPADIVDWVRTELQAGHDREKTIVESKIAGLNGRYAQLQRLIDGCYEDKLKGDISVEDWQRRTNDWREEQAGIEAALADTRVGNQSYIEDGVRLLELSQRIGGLYLAANLEEKRELAGIVLQNFGFDGANVLPVWAKPFDALVKSATSGEWLGR